MWVIIYDMWGVICDMGWDQACGEVDGEGPASGRGREHESDVSAEHAVQGLFGLPSQHLEDQWWDSGYAMREGDILPRFIVHEFIYV